METIKKKINLTFECEVPENTEDVDLKEFFKTKFGCDNMRVNNRLIEFSLEDLCARKIQIDVNVK